MGARSQISKGRFHLNIGIGSVGLMLFGLAGCVVDAINPPKAKPDEPQFDTSATAFPRPTPLQIGSLAFGDLPVSSANPLTEEGVALGRILFHDPVLSRDSTISCASCHNPSMAFADRGQKGSVGVRGQVGALNSMPLFNLAWSGSFFWNGRASSLEEQALMPVTNPVEMDLTWPEAANRLRASGAYRTAFRKAFGDQPIDSLLVARALAQFQRTLISSGSRYDQWRSGAMTLTSEEELGYAVFNSQNKGDCAVCHREPHFTHFGFANIGLDTAIEGTGKGGVTGNASEMGLWKTPSLRNLAFTSPYMHDGRFATLDEVLDFYETGGHFTRTLDANIHNPNNPNGNLPGRRGHQLTREERQALLAFLNTLNDSAFVNTMSDSIALGPLSQQAGVPPHSPK